MRARRRPAKNAAKKSPAVPSLRKPRTARRRRRRRFRLAAYLTRKTEEHAHLSRSSLRIAIALALLLLAFLFVTALSRTWRDFLPTSFVSGPGKNP